MTALERKAIKAAWLGVVDAQVLLGKENLDLVKIGGTLKRSPRLAGSFPLPVFAEWQRRLDKEFNRA